MSGPALNALDQEADPFLAPALTAAAFDSGDAPANPAAGLAPGARPASEDAPGQETADRGSLLSGTEEAILGAAKDKSWRVRLAAAEALRSCPNRRGATVANNLLDDPSPAVQAKAVASAGQWPLSLAGPVLLTAMGKPVVMTRKTAAEQLAARWPPAGEFRFDAPAETRRALLERLEQRFRRDFGSVDPAALRGANGNLDAEAGQSLAPAKIEQLQRVVKQLSAPAVPPDVQQRAVGELTALGPGVIGALEHLALDLHETLPEAVYCEALPAVAPAFAALERMTSPDVSVRRRAASQLARLAGERPLRRLAVERLASLATRESDALVWQSALVAVADDPNEAAARMAYAAIGHSAPEVRRRACEHLAAHPDPNHVPVLLPALQDSSPEVAQAAVRAIGFSGRLDDTRPVRQLLGATNEWLRLETAVALIRLGDRSGVAALERLGYSNDPTVRRHVAVAMGETGDRSFAPSLVRFLDDHLGVRRAALESLPKVVGRDVAAADGQPPADPAERVEAWKRWFRSSGQ